MKAIGVMMLLVVAFAGCDKPLTKKVDFSTEQLPSCVTKLIEKIQNEPVRNPPAKIYLYTYNGQVVYFIPQYCCDIPSELLDINCNGICSPDGGITGGGDGKCRDFFSKRENEQLIWADSR